ncbi:2TM domain-containing protein [Polaribacter aestuariivivens]|uniref:2TM domain-containing protein n=1 Tax=Polaribacter aestuariivivens TaxID=2304626 RepID=UPI003F498292
MKQDFWEEQQYIKAKKRVKDIKAFYTHLSVYCVIIPTIIFINLTFEPHFHWFWFSLIGWGLGLFCHWLIVFGIRLLGFEKNWEERKIKEFMNEKNN